MIVKSHTHIIGEDGACTECGKSCGHIGGNINYDSGICETCGKQLEAAVQYKDGAVVGFESFLSALDSVPHNMTEEVTVVLLQNYELNSEYNLNVSNNIRLDLNTHTIFGTGSFIVKGASEFTLAHGDLGENITVKAEFNGYIGYSGTFRITAAVCEHPGYDKDHKCIQCGCDLAAAQTDENKGCTLKMFADVNEKVAVKTGSFTLDATDCKINGALNVAKGADLTVSGGEITGNVICAKGGKLTASDTYFKGIINYLGSGDFRNCIFMGAVSPKSGSMKLNSCEIHGALSVSGNAEAEKCVISGTVTVNNGGSLKSTDGTTYSDTVNVKSGGTLEIISGIFGNILTAEEGSKLIVSDGSYAKVEAENNVDFTINGGKFTRITVSGQFLIDCLADGKALEDLNIGEIIDGRVGIAGNVQVVDHTHICVWKTETHEKLCGCGFVEAIDTEAPVISGIENRGACYGPTEFTVSDENDFTVWVDGKQITLVNGKYTVEPDNQEHKITATDIAGNTVTYQVWFYKIYNVTLPAGAGYTIFSSDLIYIASGSAESLACNL